MEAQGTAPARKRRLRLTWRDILGWRFSLLDDAGIQHHVDTHAMGLGSRRKSRHRARLRVPRTELLPSIASCGVGLAAYVLAFTALSMLWPPATRTQPQDGLVTMIAVTIATCAAFAFSGARFRHRRAKYIGLMKSSALCPTCISSLEGLPVPPDGLVPCPECGAKWHFSPAAVTP